MSVVIETTIGDITVDLYLKERPNTCLNFLKLCKIKYYNLCLFHKVERNFIAQSGDPTSTGRGGESIFSCLYGDQAKYFESELKPKRKHEKIGTLSMVNNGSNMNGSQFFLTLGENLTYLDEVHTVFGEVVEGFDILLKLNESICDSNNRPYQDIRITHTVVLHDPYDDPSGLNVPDASPIPTREMLETDYIAPDEEIDDTKGKNTEEIEEKIKESEAKARATILEMVGDIPDADVKPPENVLFVCKLNPVTTSEDLELIFSRFGTIVSCEVIKDKKSGESLQYAFIEFEKEEDCENAYFKMDNVLIDDRRIHVDFSQSVSKLNWNNDNRFLNQKSNKRPTYAIKDKDRKSDGYEMIFDMDEESSHSKNKKYKSKNDSHSSKRRKHSNSPTNRRNHPSISHDKHRSAYVRSPSPVKSFKRDENRKSRSPVRQKYSVKNSSFKNVKDSRRHDSSSDSSASSLNRKQIKHHTKNSDYSKSKRYNSENSHSFSNEKNRSPSDSHSKNTHDSKYHSKHSSRVLSKSVYRKPETSSSESRSMSPDIQNKKDKRKDSNYSSTSKNHSSKHHDKYYSKAHSKSAVASHHKSKSSSSSPESDDQAKNMNRKKSNYSSSSKIQSSNSYEKHSSRVNSKSSVGSHHRSKSSSSSESVDQTKNKKRKDYDHSSSSKSYSSKHQEKNSSRVHSKSSVTSHHRSKSSSSSSESVSSELYHKKKSVKSSKHSSNYKKLKHGSLSPENSKNSLKVSHSSHKNSKHKEKYTNSYSNESDEESNYTNKKLNSYKSSSSKHYHKNSRNRRSSS